MENYNGKLFLDKLYNDLHLSDEVMHTESPSDSKEEKIREFLDRLKNIEIKTNIKHPKYLKKLYFDKYIIKEEEIPESYYVHQQQIALERGYGHIEISSAEKVRMSQLIINDQKKSLENWLDYFLSSDTDEYPYWFKYYAFQGMLKLGSFDKEKQQFNRRTKGTTSIFIDLNGSLSNSVGEQ